MERIQLSRAKGWKLPPNTVNVARGPGRIWGNPFTVAGAIEAGYTSVINEIVVECFANWLRGDRQNWMGPESDAAAALILARLPELRGKNLACWCKIISHDGYVPCHADVLLSLANDIPMEEVIRENTRRAEGETL